VNEVHVPGGITCASPNVEVAHTHAAKRQKRQTRNMHHIDTEHAETRLTIPRAFVHRTHAQPNL
jgi:hypothetical protein